MRVVVIGGGISGLACVHRLLELKKENGGDFELTLFEAGPRLGGVIETEVREGFVLEKGPDSFLSEKPAVTNLARRLGIESEIIGTEERNRRSFVLRRGRFIPLRAGSLRRTPLFSWQEKHRAHAPRYGLLRSFKEGMGTLVRGLLSKIPPQAIRLNTAVKDLPAADAVCVCLPPSRAAELLKNSCPGISEKLRAVKSESIATLNIAYRSADISHPLDGFGFVVPKTENRTLMACSFSSKKLQGRAPGGFELLRAFVGGAFGRNFLEMDDKALVKAVLKDLSEILRIRGRPLFYTLRRYPASMIQYRLGHRELVAEIKNGLRHYDGLHLAGAAYGGVGIPDCVGDAEREAEKIFKEVIEKKTIMSLRGTK